MSLTFHDFSHAMQQLRPAKSVRLFRHFRNDNLDIPMTALLAAISKRPNAFLLEELIELGSTHASAGVAAAALHAAAYIGTDSAERSLWDCAQRDLPGAKAAWFIAAALSRNLEAMDEIASAIQDPNLPHNAGWLDDVRHNAIWAAGELGRVNPDFTRKVLSSVRFDAHDPYGRALAWVGFAKTGHVGSKTEFQGAFERASNFFERLNIIVAASIADCPEFLAAGLATAIKETNEQGSPLYRLIAHIQRDVRYALQEHAGDGGKALIQLLDLGDFT